MIDEMAKDFVLSKSPTVGKIKLHEKLERHDDCSLVWLFES